MKLRLFSIVFLICLAGGIYAEDVTPSSSSPSTFFIGLGPEINAHTREGVAIGGAIAGGFEFDSQFAIGLKAGFFHNMDTLTTIEPLAFFRYYLPFGGVFVQAEAGSVLYFEDGETYSAFSGGLLAGLRFNFSDYYVEPALRFGYPYMWGVGVMVGYRF
jgi:hypothetical protein